MNRRPSKLTFAALGLLVLGVAWAYGPLLVEFSTNTWKNKPHYQHFPFVLLAAGLLFARGLAQPTGGDPPGRWWAPIGVVIAWLLLVPAHLIPSPLLAVASLFLLLGAAGCMIARAAGRPFSIGSWLLLWLVLPPPVGLDGQLIQTLQRQSSVLASQSLDAIGVNHLMDGNALVLPDKTLFVDEACSGVVSAMSIVSCAAMYAVWRCRGFAHTFLLMGLAAGWAMLLNVVRIVAIALAHEYAGWDWAEGIAHTGVGLATFGLGLVTLVATDWLLMAILAEVGPRWTALTGEPIRYGQWLVGLWDRLVASKETDPQAYSNAGRLRWDRLLTGSVGLTSALAVSVAFAAVGGLNLTRVEPPELEVDFPAAQEIATRLQQEGVMPEEVAGLKLVLVEHQQRDDDSLFAQHSVVYVYEAIDGDRYLVSCDFPYVGGWHELSVCYRGIGWRLDKRTVEKLDIAEQSSDGSTDATIQSGDVAFLDLTKPDGRSGLVAFCGWFVDGTPAEAPASTFKESLYQVFRRGEAESRHSFQAQVLVERQDGVSASDREPTRKLLDAARSRFHAATVVAR